ncbi:ABC transporter ATP-binding protein [Pseudotabrizicola formosa]|uniref:ABC transporter ATP-binding protein n=1 Tax=Pseudotabrizicola formosa TaxID=2030009 RepID=UPI0011AF9FA7|nr:ATP-binding cassette domain-containing protein [Pseudotabrizicola formosa]
MSDVLACDGVAVRYPFAAADAVGPLTLRLARGDRVLLLGPSGCGKSTLLQALTGLIPAALPGARRGQLHLFGQPVESRSPADWAAQVAFLFQDADQTLAGFTLADELAFALENRALPPDDIAARVAQAMAQAGLHPDWMGRRIATLSGGQKQMVALTAVLAQGADLVVADEPTASLAPGAAKMMADLLLAPGKTVLIVDHRLGPVLDRIDRVVVLGRDGQTLAEGPPDKVFASHGADLAAQGIWTPLATRLRLALAAQGVSVPAVVQVADLVAHLPPHADLAPLLLPAACQSGTETLRLNRVDCAPPFGPVVLRNISLGLRAGEVLGILGPNGAGKSTLAACLAGLIPPRAGQRTGPPGAMAFQNADSHFAAETTRAECLAMGVPAADCAALLAGWGLDHVATQHPFSLSAGQKRRLALALLTATDRWPVLVLDEPTAGLDHAGTTRIAGHIRRLAGMGKTLAVITHDADFALSVCDRVIVLAEGRVQADGPARTVLRDTALLQRCGLAPPEAAPLLHWMDRTPC